MEKIPEIAKLRALPDSSYPFPKKSDEDDDLKQFTASELHAAPAEVCEQAYRGPVEIFKNRRRKFVILAASDYDELVEKARSMPDRQPNDSRA